MESILQNQSLVDMFANDEEYQRLQNEVNQLESKCGFQNVAFQERTLPQLQKKYGPTDSYSNLHNEDDTMPEPMQFPSEIKPKVIRYDVKSSVSKPKNSTLTTFDDFKKSKKRSTQKTVIPPHDFAPLKRISSDNAENLD